MKGYSRQLGKWHMIKKLQKLKAKKHAIEDSLILFPQKFWQKIGLELNMQSTGKHGEKDQH